MVYIFAYDMFVFQVRDEKKVQLLSRSLSGFHMRAFVSPISSIVCLPLCLPLSFCGNFSPYIACSYLVAYGCGLISFLLSVTWTGHPTW